MPYRGPVRCKEPGCPALIPYGQSYCERHKALHKNDRKSGAARGYNSRWQKARKRYLSDPQHMFCVRCLEEGKYIRATVVDHIIPHRGDRELFWDENNWQPLCEHHHNVKTMTEDRYEEYKF